jgi:hypothetical protein
MTSIQHITSYFLIGFLIAYKDYYLVVTKMQGFDIYGAENGGPGMEYPKSDGNGNGNGNKLSGASTIPKGDHAPVGVFDGAAEPCQTKTPQLDQSCRGGASESSARSEWHYLDSWRVLVKMS